MIRIVCEYFGGGVCCLSTMDLTSVFSAFQIFIFSHFQVLLFSAISLYSVFLRLFIKEIPIKALEYYNQVYL